MITCIPVRDWLLRLYYCANQLRLLLGLLILASDVAGASSPCDPLLLTDDANPYGYRLRGDRCEGLYVQQVSGALLAVVSWTVGRLDYDLQSNRPLIIEWDDPKATGPVRLRAQGLRRRLYYQMDAIPVPDGNLFKWPIDVLSGIGISARDVGIVCLTDASIEGAQRQVYLPLRIGQDQKPASGGGYSLTLLPGVEMNELFLTLTGPSARNPSFVLKRKPVGNGPYPAGRPIEISIPAIHSRGFYRLQIGSTMRSGGVAANELWLYNPGT